MKKDTYYIVGNIWLATAMLTGLIFDHWSFWIALFMMWINFFNEGKK